MPWRRGKAESGQTELPFVIHDPNAWEIGTGHPTEHYQISHPNAAHLEKPGMSPFADTASGIYGIAGRALDPFPAFTHQNPLHVNRRK